jgi:cell division septation protein DedD
MSDKHYVHAPDTTKLEALLKQSKPWFDRYATALIYLVAAVMAVAAGMIWFGKQPAEGTESSEALMLAQTAEDYQDVADTFPDTEIAIRARLRQADLMLQNATSGLFENRKVGLEELDSAQKAYESLANRSDLPSDVRQRVLVGMARIVESHCDGSNASVDAAIAAWQRILDEYKDSMIFQSLAEERIKRLPLESTRSFYAWFQAQDPKPGDDSLLLQDGPTSAVPGAPDASAFPGVDLESLLGPGADSASPFGLDLPKEADTTTEPESTQPKTEETTPTLEIPATTEPTSDTPASDTPATDTPAGSDDSPTEAPAADGSAEPAGKSDE